MPLRDSGRWTAGGPLRRRQVTAAYRVVISRDRCKSRLICIIQLNAAKAAAAMVPGALSGYH
jgi:hypothetical protein